MMASASPTSAMIRELASEVLRTPSKTEPKTASASVAALTDDISTMSFRVPASAPASPGNGVVSEFEQRVRALEREAEGVEDDLRVEEREHEIALSALRRERDIELEREAVRTNKHHETASLREALRAKERAIASLTSTLASTREEYARRELEAKRTRDAADDDFERLRERVRALEANVDVHERALKAKNEVIEALKRDLEAKRAFDRDVVEQTKALEIDRLERRAEASEERARVAESKVEVLMLEKASMTRELEALRERVARLPTQAEEDEAFKRRVERAADARVAAERILNEEMRTKAELAALFAQIRDMTLRTAGARAAPSHQTAATSFGVHPTVDSYHRSPTVVEEELRRVKVNAEQEIAARRREFNDIQAEVTRENARLRRELSNVRATLREKLCESTKPTVAFAGDDQGAADASPWAADFTFPLTENVKPSVTPVPLASSPKPPSSTAKRDRAKADDVEFTPAASMTEDVFAAASR
jgi:hypothetical protein